ncbi:terpene synthase family protein [Yinghuangia soli]|uniref:Uncharacterized protein n=1 Tax=Yinghuangia soli TaxID=2908204 RepID=A0AA41U4L5_9ACTN|nr:terpene synthase family protein [Yinghuangia soli]MCF2530927.1 hypothetical protein [Yinghuangia soli]
MPRDLDRLIADTVAHVASRCPRPAPHPAADAVAMEARTWARRTGLSAAAEGGAVDRTHPVAPVAEAMHDAPVGALRITGLFATWLAVLEDRGEAVGWDPAYAASLVGILRDGHSTGADALHFALTDLRERITAAGGAALLPDLADALARHAAAAHREQDWLAAEAPPALPEFLDNRVDRTGVPLFTLLHRLDPALGAPGGPPAEGVPPLTELAGLLVGVAEDLTGYPRAMQTGTRLTLVPVLMREYGHSVPTAFQSATVLYGAWRTQLDHGVRALRSLPGVSAATVRQAQSTELWAAALNRHDITRGFAVHPLPVG